MTKTHNGRKPRPNNVISAVHDPVNNKLHVTFNNGAIYSYDGVTAKQHQEMLGSPSPGAYLHAKIKDKHAFTKNLKNFKAVIPKKDVK